MFCVGGSSFRVKGCVRTRLLLKNCILLCLVSLLEVISERIIASFPLSLKNCLSLKNWSKEENKSWDVVWFFGHVQVPS